MLTKMTRQKSLGFLVMRTAGFAMMSIDISSSLLFMTCKNRISMSSSRAASKLSLLSSISRAKESTTTTTTTSVVMMMRMSTAAAAADTESSTSNSPIPSDAAVPKKKQERNFVFGYGSLMCDQSRSLTNPTLGIATATADGDKVAGTLPVTIHNVQRVWSARTKTGWTAVGVRFEQDWNCTGVLMEVTADELTELDKREASYTRHPLCLDHIEQVSFLNPQEFYNDHHPVFDAKEENNSTSNNETTHIKVWIYTQRDAIFADSSHPIPQSYVDIILRGCLKISKDFAKSFIETTYHWDHHHDNDDHVHYYFVNDREIPIYPKADPEFSNEHCNQRIIDQLLQEYIPNVMANRVDYDPLHHLEALSDALEQDKAHPRAIKHIVTILKKATRNKTV
jgi:cation transport regulator ChaC